MEPLKILGLVEDTIQEVFLWLWLLPKTLYRVVRDPEWAAVYVPGELARKEGRYDEYLSPVLTLLLAGVLPYLGLAGLAGSLRAAREPLPTATLLLAAFLLGLLPAVWAGAGLVGAKRALTRPAFRAAFGVQCLLFAPMYTAFLAPLFAVVLFQRRGWSPRVLAAPALILWALALAWLLRAQWRVARSSAVALATAADAPGGRAWRGGFVASLVLTAPVAALAWAVSEAVWP